MLLIYLPQTSPRTEYVFELLFKHELGIEYKTTNDIELFKNYQQEKINYSAWRIKDELFVKASSLLWENLIQKKDIVVEERHETKVLFPNDESCDIGFDLFSAIFYMVSRYEEYLPFTADQYGRFKASDSVAFQNNFLEKPIVNIWINIFKTVLQKKFPPLKIKNASFKAVITYDIDIAYKFKGRNFIRTIGSIVKDILSLKWKNIFERIMTLVNIKKDPWDVYDSLRETIIHNNLSSIFFFLLADKTANDRNLHHENPVMKRLIQKIQKFSEIGIHPSFNSSVIPEKIPVEKERLEKISGKEITKSRQHYLKFNLPETYNSLLSSGVTEDYSMGFPAMSGFRAGTCKPFYFYDLKNETATDLKIFPVSCMDATFKYYNKQSAEKTLMEILNLLKEVKKFDGTFISIWHNDNLGQSAENKKWNSVHNKMIMQIKAYLKK